MAGDDEVYMSLRLHKKAIARLRRAQKRLESPPMRPPTLSTVLIMAVDALERDRSKR